MPAWFSLDRVNSEDVGIHVKTYPDRVVPKRRGVKADVPGGQPAHMWDGAWGYGEMMLTVEIYVDGDAAPEVVAAFLQPEEREIIFGDDPGYVLHGRLEDQVDLEKVMRARKPRTATLNFYCSPFKHLAWPGEAEEITAVTVLEHPGSARSWPTIKVWGEGEGSILIRGTEEFAVKGLVSGEALVIDSGAMVCTNGDGTQDRSGDTEGDYPYFDPGESSVSFTGGITKLEIAPNWAWLGR